MPALELINTTLFNDANLVAYWRLENVNDSKGSNTLTNNNTVAFNAGKFGNAADGGSANTNKSLSQDSNSPAGITFAQFASAWTVMGWVNITTQGASEPCMWGFQVSDGSHRRNAALVFASDGTIHLTVFDGTTNDYTTTSGAISTGTWTMVTATYDGTNLRVYDGATKVLTQARTFLSQADAQTGGFGILCTRQNGGSFQVLSGLVDDTAVFTRQLSDTEVSNHFNGLDGLSSAHNLSLLGIGT